MTFRVGDPANQPAVVIQVRGSIADLNAGLDGLAYQTPVDFHGTTELRLELNDLGNGGTHIVEDAIRAIVLDVLAAPDVPAILPQTFYLTYDYEESEVARFTVAGSVTAHNPDPQLVLRYAITAGNDDQAFSLDAVTGSLIVADNGPLGPDEAHVLTARVYYESDPTFFAEAPLTVHNGPEFNGRPQLGDDNYTLSEEASITGNLILGDALGGQPDTDADNDPLMLTAATDSDGQDLRLASPRQLPSGATLTVSADGSFTYDAATSSQFDVQYQSQIESADWFTYAKRDFSEDARSPKNRLKLGVFASLRVFS